MSHYAKQELEEAKTSLASTLSKCEKIQEGGKLQSSQKTLNDRRVNALRRNATGDGSVLRYSRFSGIIPVDGMFAEVM